MAGAGAAILVGGALLLGRRGSGLGGLDAPLTQSAANNIANELDKFDRKVERWRNKVEKLAGDLNQIEAEGADGHWPSAEDLEGDIDQVLEALPWPTITREEEEDDDPPDDVIERSARQEVLESLDDKHFRDEIRRLLSRRRKVGSKLAKVADRVNKLAEEIKRG